MSPRLRMWLRRLLLLALLGGVGTAIAHEMSMAEMAVRETRKGEFLWQWTATSDRTGNQRSMSPQWPEGCTAQGNLVRCGAAGMRGRLGMHGVGTGYSAALVKFYWLDGTNQVYTLTAGQPTVHLLGGAADARGWVEIAWAYSLLGVEHILTGYDHLMFVVALLFLVGFNRRLLWTISAFTLAHSLTLASSALGWLTLRPAPVEASIALSIMLVASEALHTRQTLARRWPALVAFLFGLVHGLGFAGALKEIGLPDSHLSVALLTFNLGVEVGQFGAVAAAWAIWRVSSRWPATARARTAVLYAIGALAAYWSWLRVVAVFG